MKFPCDSHLLRGHSGSLPPCPPGLNSGNEARQHHTSCKHKEHASKTVDVQGTGTFLGAHSRVQVTWALSGPPLQLQNIHVPILLQLQDPKHSMEQTCDQQPLFFPLLKLTILLRPETSSIN